jgi:hypothetical protein
MATRASKFLNFLGAHFILQKLYFAGLMRVYVGLIMLAAYYVTPAKSGV